MERSRRTGRRRPALLAMLLAMVSVVLGGPMPVTATHAPSADTTVTVPGGWVKVHAAYRSGWGVKVELRVHDAAADGHCVYAEVEIIVTDSYDPDAEWGRTCGKGTARSFTKRLAANLGTTIEGVRIYACVDDWGFDTCRDKRLDLAQHTPHATTAQMTYMDGVMAMSMADFVAEKRRAPAGYDWTDDGCSAPAWLVAPLIWNERFKRACQRHDFGYRNYGKRYLWPTDRRRRIVDEKMRADMYRLCAANSWDACYVTADAYFAVVREKGGVHFYHRD